MAGARRTVWMLMLLLAACSLAALARHGPISDGGSERGPLAINTIRLGRLPLQVQSAVPSYFKGSGRIKALTPLSTAAGSFDKCVEDIEVAYTAGANRVLNITKLAVKSSKSVTMRDSYVSGYDPETGTIETSTRDLQIPCSDGYLYEDSTYKPIVTVVGLPARSSWQCLKGMPTALNATPVEWTGTQPECASLDGQRCIKPAVCKTAVTDVKARKLVKPLTCGPHHASVWPGNDGYTTADTWCSVARKRIAPSFPNSLPPAGSWVCLAGLPGVFKNTPIRWMGLNPQCDSLDGIRCNKPASCQARLKELAGAVTPLTCGPYHQSVWGITGYEKADHWCSISRKQLAPNEAEVLPVRVQWVLGLIDFPSATEELTLWLVRGKYADGLQAFSNSSLDAPVSLPSATFVKRFQVLSGSVFGYAAPPSYYAGSGRVQATVQNPLGYFDACLDDVQFSHAADDRRTLLINGFSVRSTRIATIRDTCYNGYDENGNLLTTTYDLNVPCKDGVLYKATSYAPKIQVLNSTVELLPVRVQWSFRTCELGVGTEVRTLWLVRQTNVAQLQAFTTAGATAPKAIAASTLRKLKLVNGTVFGFKR